jgi:hypothetical protein
MEKENSLMSRSVNRRSLLKTGALAGGAAAIGAGFVGTATSAFAEQGEHGEQGGSRVTKSDIAILTFLAPSSRLKPICGYNTRNLAELRIKGSPPSMSHLNPDLLPHTSLGCWS